MASKKKSKKKSTPLWQWALLALGAFLLYRGLQYYLSPERYPPKKTISVKKTPETTTPHEAGPSPTPGVKGGPIQQWDFKSTGQLLPEGAYPDNFVPIPVKESQSGLLAFAKTLPGKRPGPQGLTNTQPGLSLFRWKDKKYEGQELKFSDLEPALSGINVQKFSGPPQVSKKPFSEAEAEIFTTQIFMGDDPRQVMAFFAVDATGIHWAPLQEADGKKLPAAFVKGTTKDTTRNVHTEKHSDKNYLIVETGKLDPAKLYEGYHWKVEAYFWNGQSFVYDNEYSDKLTKDKKDH
jgi:hypothetical protein